MRQLNFPAMKNLVAADGIEPSPCRLSADCSPGEPCGSGSQRETGTPLSALPKLRIAIYPCREQLWGRRGCSKSQSLAYETSVLPLELHRRITGASSQSLTGFSGIQILRIDVNAYEAKRAPASYRKTTPPKGRLDSNQDFRQLGAVYQTRTGVCRLAVCRPSHWTNTANLWSGVRESNPSNWFGRPAPKRSANPARHTYPIVKELTTQLVRTAGFEPASPCFRSR